MAISGPITKSRKSAIEGAVTLKRLAAHLSLNPSTVSVVLNNVPGRSIPAATRERIWDAARTFGYIPNSLARSLRTKKTRTVGILLPDIASNDHAEILSGITEHLALFDYCCIVLPHGHKASPVAAHIDTITSRGVEGLIFIDTYIEHDVRLPSVCIGGSGHHIGTAIQIDLKRAATLLLGFAISRGVKTVQLIESEAIQDRCATTLKTIFEGVGSSLGLRLKYRKAPYSEQSRCLRGPLPSKEPGLPDRSVATLALDAEAASVLLSRHPSELGYTPWLLHVHTGNNATCPAATATVRRSSRGVAQIAAEVLLRKLEHQHDFPVQIEVEPELVIEEVRVLQR